MKAFCTVQITNLNTVTSVLKGWKVLAVALWLQQEQAGDRLEQDWKKVVSHLVVSLNATTYQKASIMERTWYNLPATAVNACSLKIHFHQYSENLKTHLVFITEQNCMNKLITLTDCSCLCNCCSLLWHRERVIPAVAIPCLIRQQHCPLLSPGKNCT